MFDFAYFALWVIPAILLLIGFCIYVLPIIQNMVVRHRAKNANHGK